MYLLHIFSAISFVLSVFSIVGACKGCVNLDEHNFDKIVPRFDAVLVKFDVNFPHGEKQDIFSDLADELVDNKNIILAQVPIRDYGKNKNKEFGKRHGVRTSKDLPLLKLYVKGEDEPFVFEKSLNWDSGNLKQFIRNHTRIYWGLPGRLEDFDKLAIKFVYSNDREAVLKEAELEANKILSGRQKNIAQTYINYMKNIIESGFPYAFAEWERLEKEMKELSHRLNIIKLFTTDPKEIQL